MVQNDAGSFLDLLVALDIGERKPGGRQSRELIDGCNQPVPHFRRGAAIGHDQHPVPRRVNRPESSTATVRYFLQVLLNYLAYGLAER